MSFQIEILKVGVENKGKYRVAVVDHKTVDGKVDSKKVMSFVNKDVFTTLSSAQTGDQFDVTSEKDKNGYWQWITVVPAGKANGTSPAKTASSNVRSSYETPEERAARQVYIVRQSSIANALTYYSELVDHSKGKQPSVDDIVSVARLFEGYVFGADSVKDELNDVEVE